MPLPVGDRNGSPGAWHHARVTGFHENEFSDLDRTVQGPDGTTFRVVISQGSQIAGRSLFRRGDQVEAVPVVNLLAAGEERAEAYLLHTEPATSRADAERIIGGLKQEIEDGAFDGR